MIETYHIPQDVLQAAALELFKASGSPAEEAMLLAERLVGANLAGHDSHGVIRIPAYLGMLRDGKITPGIEISILKDGGSTVLVDGHWGYGQTAMEQTSRIAVERAGQHGIAAVGVTNLLHIGRLADYAITAANAGKIGLVGTSAGGFAQRVAPFGGIAARLATNPFAAAFPGNSSDPIVFDMATSTVAEGKVQVMRDANAQAADGILIDKQGNPTNDPDDLYDNGSILPVGGPQGFKGYLWAFMVEVLAGILTGGGFCGRDADPRFNNCTFMICIDVQSFRPLDVFKDELDQLIGYLKNTPSHPGKEVLAPGEVEVRQSAERRRTGVPLAAETVRKLQAELEYYEIPLQLATQVVPAPPAP